METIKGRKQEWSLGDETESRKGCVWVCGLSGCVWRVCVVCGCMDVCIRVCGAYVGVWGCMWFVV